MPDAARIAQATVLEIPVTIQGSKIVEGTERRELFTETTKTTLTFDDGAVLHLKARVVAGQSVFLRNDQSGKEILCKVLEAQPEGQAGYTDLEFTVPDPEFWGVPAEDPAPAGYTSDGHEAIEAPHESLVAIPNMESSAPAAVEIPVAVPETPVPLSFSSLPETTEALLDPAEGAEPHVEKDAEQLAAMMAKEARGFLKRAFHAKEAKQTKQETTSEAAPKQSETGSGNASGPKAFSPLAFRIRGIFTFTTKVNPIAVGIAAAVLIVAALGFVWHARRGSPTHSSNRTSANIGASTGASSIANPGQIDQRANQQAIPLSAQPSPVPTLAVTAVAKTPATTAAAVGAVGRGNTIKDSAPSIASKSAASEAKPSDGMVSADDASLQPSPGRAKHQKPNGLNTQETVPAKIVSQPQPSFPLWAKDLDVDGVVKLDALIDEKGNVAETKPLSGPRALQHAAEGAVGLWIFEPALSDGKPTATHMVLTVQFQR